MPIGAQMTMDGRVYSQQVSDSEICNSMGYDGNPCNLCWLPVPLPEIVQPTPMSPGFTVLAGELPPPMPAYSFDSESMSVEPMPIPARMTAATPKKPYVHPTAPVLGDRVTNRNAACYHCRKYARSARPVFYCDTGIGDVIEPVLVCEDCQRLYYRLCNDHSGWVNSGNTIVTADTEERYTVRYARANFIHVAEGNSWYTTRAAANAAIQTVRDGPPTYGYHETNPINRFGWPAETLKHELCFGVELEMEHKRDTRVTGQILLSRALGGRNGELEGARGKYILARDGSLNSSGLELITSPYTLGFHQKEFGWPTVLAAVKGLGRSGKGTEACGMHVHCNRLAISALTLGKMLVFVNHPSNNILINRIAQRDGQTFAMKIQKKISEGKRERGERKYDALNITAMTIECRIFKGNLRPERVLKNIEFCHALINYCMVASIASCHNHTDFITWLGVNRGMYKNLVRFLAPHHGYKLTQSDSSEDI